ncbi:MAG: hypothetical protein M1825_002405 [Sarcosagium campestre]|nr:MAG: hypothetical protein M1825_002405 [Sarcosagium campestre]
MTSPVRKPPPGRKASKKALEEMNRETQRLARNMHLAPRAAVKKKFSKEAFLERFNRNDVQAPKTPAPRPSKVESAQPQAFRVLVNGKCITPSDLADDSDLEILPPAPVKKRTFWDVLRGKAKPEATPETKPHKDFKALASRKTSAPPPPSPSQNSRPDIPAEPNPTVQHTEQLIPGLPRTDRPAMGLSQMFAATMADSHEEQPAESKQIVQLTEQLIPGLPRTDGPAIGLSQMFAATMADGLDQQSDGEAEPLSDEFPDPDLFMQRPLDSIIRECSPILPDIESEFLSQESGLENPNLSDNPYLADGPLSPDNPYLADSPLSPDNPYLADGPLTPDNPYLSKNPYLLNNDWSKNGGVASPGTQISDYPDPTPDVGFTVMSPLQTQGFVEPSSPSSQDSLYLDKSQNPISGQRSPIKRRRGRLVPRALANTSAVRKKVAPLDRKNSVAKGLFEEHAEESDDEYAGIGGASDDGDTEDEEEAEEMREMLDDQTQAVDGAHLAAFHADRERDADKKETDKLYRDITDGRLRKRRRGADFDLSDSDDGAEARREAKRRKFAKMRRALFEDEKVGKLAANPKKVAFLRTIDVWGEDGAPSASSEDDEDEAPAVAPPLKRKRPEADAASDGEEQEGEEADRAPKPKRRRSKNRTPKTREEVRAALADLINPPIEWALEKRQKEAEAAAAAAGLSTANPHPRRTRHTGPVIDRQLLIREESLKRQRERATMEDPPYFKPGVKVIPGTRIVMPNFGERMTTYEAKRIQDSFVTRIYE